MKLPFAWSISRALYLTIFVSLVPALAIIIWTGVEQSEALEESVRVEAIRQVESIVHLQNQMVTSVRYSLATMAQLPAFRDSDRIRQREILEIALANNPEYENIAVVDMHGVVTVSPFLPAETVLSDRLHVQAALRDGGFATGEFVLARTTGAPSFPFAYAIHNASGEKVGAITVAYRLNSYAALFDRWALPTDAMLVMTDHDGVRVLVRPSGVTDPIGEPINEALWAVVSADKDSGTMKCAGCDGIVRLYAYSALYSTDDGSPYGHVLLGSPYQYVVRSGRRALLRNLILMAVVIVLAYLLMRGLGGAMFGWRFSQLTKTAQAISEGDLQARTEIPTDGSELSLVARSIDNMAMQLELRNTERIEEEQRLQHSLREKETLLKEVHHRVKNNMQLILSIVHLQREYTDDVEDFVWDLESRVRSMAMAHEMLYESPDLSTIRMEQFLPRLAVVSARAIAADAIHVNADEITLRLEHAVPMALIATELIGNACKYGVAGDGTVSVNVSFIRENENIVLTVADKGPGFPPYITDDSRVGLGVRLVTSLTKQLRGEVSFANAVGAPVDGAGTGGAIATIRIPSLEA